MAFSVSKESVLKQEAKEARARARKRKSGKGLREKV
jgi:hypothetical protein